MNDELIKPCPCGQTPDKIIIQAEHQKPKFALAVPSCCEEWWIEYRNGYADIDSDAGKANALTAWNNAPRGGLK